MAITSLPALASLASTSTTRALAPQAPQSAFARDVAQLKQDLLTLQGEGAGKVEGSKLHKAGETGVDKSSESSESLRADLAEVQKLVRFLQKLVHMPQALLSRPQRPEDSTKAPPPSIDS